MKRPAPTSKLCNDSINEAVKHIILLSKAKQPSDVLIVPAPGKKASLSARNGIHCVPQTLKEAR